MDYFLKNPRVPEQTKRCALEALKYAVPWGDLAHPKIPYMEQDQIITQPLEQFAIGLISAEEALRQIEEKLNRKIGR